MAFAHADAFVSLCGVDREYVLNLGLYRVERTAVVEPGLDREYLSMPFIPKKEERVAFTGTWTARKGVSNLSAVMTRVLRQNQNLYFDIYGTGRAQDTVLADFPAEIHHRIVVYPPLSNQEMAEGLARAQVFFFPSQYEGFGIVLSEAMACSCAVVTTPTGFGADLHHRQEALLCDFNDVDAMAQAVLQLLQDEELRLKIARGGWERVRSLNWEANIKKLEATYCQWIEEHQKSL
jgi:glycosyltransferase involved in cell wall biosynthesis